VAGSQGGCKGGIEGVPLGYHEHSLPWPSPKPHNVRVRMLTLLYSKHSLLPRPKGSHAENSLIRKLIHLA